MNTKLVTIEVEAPIAEAFAAASSEKQQEMQRLIGYYMRHLTGLPDQSLQEAMDQARQEATANGLTPEILGSLLNEPG